jgi:hypothetical protein
MNYPASLQDFFKSPKWTTNLLLAALCCLIPIVGPMVVLGWLLNGFWGRNEGRAETFPDFNFDNFGQKLERGLWPTLVGIVAGVIVSPVLVIVMLLGMFMVGGAASATGSETAGSGIAMIGSLMIGLVILAIAIALAFVMTPAVLRAALMQDFGAAFNMPFVKRFLSLVKKELAISMVFLGAIGIGLVVVGMIPCLGVLVVVAVIPPLKFAWAHLARQLYQLYLSRGGEPIAISPKLTEDAPPPPSPLPPTV